MNGRRTSLEEFIRQAREVHGDKYDYSRVVYVNTHTKIEIGHPDGYWFWQIPKNHLKGHEDWQSRQEKIETTTQERYGVAHPLQSSAIKQKTIQTNLDRYGVSCTLLDPTVQERIKITTLGKYGVDNPLANKDIRRKVEQTNISKYGYDNPFNDKEVRDKIKQTNLGRYGYEHAIQNNEIKQKIKKTNLDRYGMEYPIAPLNDKAKYILENKQHLVELLKTTEIEDIAEELDISITTIYRYIKIHEIRDGWMSAPERLIFEWLSSLGLKFRKDRTVLKGKEIDFLCEDKISFGMEYCGLYSHSEYGGKKDSHYHHNKYKGCATQHIPLMTIFSDEWSNKQNIVKSIILTKLGLQEKGIGARKSQISYIDKKLAKEFTNEYHIQGSTQASISLGAYNEDKLVGVMCFGSPTRQSIHPIELKRFCTNNKIYPGLASRLFSRFVQDYQPTSIVSFSDNRFFEGSIYPILGFQFDGDVKPDFYYVEKYKIRHNKSKFRKSRLAGSDGSESKTMIERGFDRIWDCGKKRFVWRNPKY